MFPASAEPSNRDRSVAMSATPEPAAKGFVHSMPPDPPERSRRRIGFLALACVGLAYVVMMQPLGWNQTSHFTLVKSLADVTPRIDRYQWETGDKSYTAGHFYTSKAPGL